MKTTEKDNKTQGVETPKDNVKQLAQNLPAVMKQAHTLPQTIKTVEDLYKKIKQRDRLELYNGNLKSFAFKTEEEDLVANTYYNGCQLEIKDDANAKFLLRNPALIKEVVEFLQGRLGAKLVEIEAEIKLPSTAA